MFINLKPYFNISCLK